jgi:biopolymer transport protein ExbB
MKNPTKGRKMSELISGLSYRVSGIMETGGIAIAPMFALGAYGFFLLLQAFTQPSMLRTKRMLADIDTMVHSAMAGKGLCIRHGGNPVLRILLETLTHDLSGGIGRERGVRILLGERLSLLFYRALRHLAIIRSLAAAAPLLGLLGTVSGLIHTFDAMHRFGFGSSGLLASGIAEALTATQCGLALAILLLVIGQFQEGRIMRLKHDVEFRIAALLRCIYLKETSNG